MTRLKEFAPIIVIATLVATSVASSATISRDTSRNMRDDDGGEKYLEGRGETARAHDRKMFAAVAHAKATANLSQATYVYTQHLHLYRENAKSEMDLLDAQIGMLVASVQHSYTDYGVKQEELNFKIGTLRLSWADGSTPRRMPELAKLYVEIRQRYLEHSESLLADFSLLSKARQRILEIKGDLAKTKVITQEELNESRVLRDQSIAELNLASEQLAFAKKALADAQKDQDTFEH